MREREPNPLMRSGNSDVPDLLEEERRAPRLHHPVGDGSHFEVGVDRPPDPHELAAFFKGPSEVGHRGVGHGAALVSFKMI